MNTWGRNIRLSIFGESHGPSIGIVIDGLPPGTEIDLDMINRRMARRAPGNSEFATPRKEADIPEILSGVKDGKTTGAPLACVIFNKNQRSGDYGDFLRPGHSDWTATLKYGGHADLRGGGHFSGRLTAPLVFAGAVALGILADKGIRIFGRIRSIEEADDGIELEGVMFRHGDETCGMLENISEKDFPAADGSEEIFKERILAAKRGHDSVGGCIEAVAVGNLAGLGEPFFNSVESSIASLMFSVPAVKGLEFGGGFKLCGLRGSVANDPIRIENGNLYSVTNNNGGILGGIANGMPLILRVAIKPTSSIAREQKSVGCHATENVDIRVGGRHDPCIASRATPVIESVVALSLLDLMMEAGR